MSILPGRLVRCSDENLRELHWVKVRFTTGFMAAGFFAWARISSWPVSARICRDWAAGWTALNSAFIRMIGIFRMSSRPMACWCGVVAMSYLLVTFACVSLLEHELLLGQEVVRERPVELPDLIQQGKFCRSVVTVIADEFTHVGPVLLLDVGAVVAVARAGPK
jgi:hypothetical protein